MSCVCERSEWEFLEKTGREAFPNDKKLLKHMWNRVSSMNQETFRDEYSNHLTFKKIRVLSLLVNSVNFSVSIESDCDAAKQNRFIIPSWDISKLSMANSNFT
jgi:hypothetical protein